MIDVHQAIRVLTAHSGYCKHVAATKEPEDKEYLLAQQGAEALDLALSIMAHFVPKAPVYSPDICSYKCSVCGCPVGFQVSPGVRCYVCPKCTQRVDWIGIDFD